MVVREGDDGGGQRVGAHTGVGVRERAGDDGEGVGAREVAGDPSEVAEPQDGVGAQVGMLVRGQCEANGLRPVGIWPAGLSGQESCRGKGEARAEADMSYWCRLVARLHENEGFPTLRAGRVIVRPERLGAERVER